MNDWQQAVQTLARTTGYFDRKRDAAARQIVWTLGAFDDARTMRWLVARQWTGTETITQIRHEMYTAFVEEGWEIE